MRTEPVLVVGGGLTTDVAGFACASYRRNTPYIRIPTTLIGLIDASVSIKVAVNYGKHKNRLGAYHASQKVLLDFSFLKTLPEDQVRNGMAELIKIAVVGNAEIFDLLEEHGPELLATRFGHLDGTPELREVGDRLTYQAIATMLELEAPNLHEIDLDRVIAFGHTWSPTLELTPPVPFFHGHAINIDMALSTTLAEQRGHLSVADRDRVLGVMSALGLALDSEHLTPELLEQATASILKTRDGLLRAAIPDPIGRCRFLNDVTVDELADTLTLHKKICLDYPRGGDGVDVFTAAEPAPSVNDACGCRSTRRHARPVTPSTILAAELGEVCRGLADAGGVDAAAAGPAAPGPRSRRRDWIPTWTVHDRRSRRHWRELARTDPRDGLGGAGRRRRSARAGDALRPRRGTGAEVPGAPRRCHGACSRSACSPGTRRWRWPRRCPTTGRGRMRDRPGRRAHSRSECFDESPAGRQDHRGGRAGDGHAAPARRAVPDDRSRSTSSSSTPTRRATWTTSSSCSTATCWRRGAVIAVDNTLMQGQPYTARGRDGQRRGDRELQRGRRRRPARRAGADPAARRPDPDPAGRP